MCAYVWTCVWTQTYVLDLSGDVSIGHWGHIGECMGDGPKRKKTLKELVTTELQFYRCVMFCAPRALLWERDGFVMNSDFTNKFFQ